MNAVVIYEGGTPHPPRHACPWCPLPSLEPREDGTLPPHAWPPGTRRFCPGSGKPAAPVARGGTR